MIDESTSTTGIGLFGFQAEEAESRRVVYSLLAQVFRTEPQSDFLRQLRRPEFLELFEDCEVDPFRDIKKGQEDSACEILAIEYARLFLGPGPHTSPHESVLKNAASSVLNGPQTAAVRDFIANAGFDYEEGFAGLPDHLSVELEFLAHLTAAEAAAWAEDAGERGRNAQSWQYSFITQHLGTWANSFVVKVTEQEPHTFYGASALLLKEFLSWEVEFLEAELREIHSILKTETDH